MQIRSLMLHVIPLVYQFCCKRFRACRNLKTLSGTSGSFRFICLSLLKHHCFLFFWLSFWILAVLQIHLNRLLGDFKIKIMGLLRSLLKSVKSFR